MIRIATPDEMRECDQRAIGEYNIPGLLLMENAGRSVSRLIQNSFAPLQGKSAFIFCGKGNNAGDGFVVARHLYNLGMTVRVFLCGGDRFTGDALTNYEILKKITSGERKISRLIIESFSSKKINEKPDLIVDALFGTGFSGEVTGIYAEAIKKINSIGSPVIAIDIPSGLHGDTGVSNAISISANYTVTMGLPKIGHMINDGPDRSGELIVADIEIPRVVYETSGIATYMVEYEDIVKRLPHRSRTAHKYSVGKIFVLAGSRGLTGAAKMSSESALRAGAGAVVLGVPEGLYQIFAKKNVEVMTQPLAQTKEMTIAKSAFADIQKRFSWADCLVFGPGLGRNDETDELLRDLIVKCDKPLLLDADALTALSGHVDLLRKRKADTIITPHIGEFCRISGLHRDEVLCHTVDIARDFAITYKIVLVLKGAPTIIAAPDGNVFINSTGNPAMATAGAGDVLSGTIAGLWGQIRQPVDSALCGVYIHGLAGDMGAEEHGIGLTASDIQKHLSHALQFVLLNNGLK